MRVAYKAKFKKQFKKLPTKIQAKFFTRLALFQKDPTHKQLHLHKLEGGFRELYSINITGDYRALFYYEGDEIVVFALIGKHSQLYK